MIKQIEYKNEAVNFSDTGKGRVVVLLHGFLGSQQIWEQQVKNLSKSYRVIAIDLPGHGQTACFGYAHGMDLMAHCVKAVLDNLNLKRYVLIGHSMGGYVTLAFANLFPENLKGFCLFHSTALADTEEKKKDRLRAIKVVRTNKNVYTKSTILNLFASKNLKYLSKEIEFAHSIAKHTTKRGIIAALHGMRDRPNHELLLGWLEIPIMMAIGEHDNILPYKQLIEQSEMIKNRTILFLEHDGHFGFLESPRLVNKELRKFLRKAHAY